MTSRSDQFLEEMDLGLHVKRFVNTQSRFRILLVSLGRHFSETQGFKWARLPWVSEPAVTTNEF